jgi:hypothetical protein
MILSQTFTFYQFTSLLVLYAAVFPTLLHAECDGDMRSWQMVSVNLYDSSDWRFQANAQTRLYDDSKFLGTWLFMPTVVYKLNPNLDLGCCYLLEDVRPEADDDFTKLHIFRIHALLRWNVNNNLSFTTRHVAGFRSVESADDYWISRHRFGFKYKLEDSGPLVGIGMDSELTYRSI